MAEDRYTSDANQRRARRKTPREHIAVTDVITGSTIGRIGNLSRTGLMLIMPQPLRDNALYQLAFELPNGHGRRARLEIGMSEQWCEAAAMPGQYWAGLHFVGIGDADDKALVAWLEAG
ncbi:MAG TPA: PilZ domain-containing protein [Rhodanobacteraceae bacterium]|nr:PilZ domain-containing protein [Rhodanobacteraceae bacterium]